MNYLYQSKPAKVDIYILLHYHNSIYYTTTFITQIKSENNIYTKTERTSADRRQTSSTETTTNDALTIFTRTKSNINYTPISLRLSRHRPIHYRQKYLDIQILTYVTKNEIYGVGFAVGIRMVITNFLLRNGALPVDAPWVSPYGTT
ncbi:hypothetical protein V6Z11_D06G020200 [Gossypium hirsutum]